MQETEIKYSPEIVDILNQLDVTRSAISAPWYNAGHFGPATIEYRRPKSLDLVPAEQFIVTTAQKYLKRFDRFNMIELGGLIGFGAVRVAYELKDAVEKKKVQIIVTNNEENEFCIESGLLEAERRIKIFGSFENHRRLMEIVSNGSKGRFNPAYPIIASNGPMLTLKEIDFLRENYYLVTYLNGIDSSKINTQFNKYTPGFEADLIHERQAGLQLGYPRNETLLSVVGILNSTRGVLVTNTDVEYEYAGNAYKVLKKRGIEQITHGIPDDYQAYAYPVAIEMLLKSPAKVEQTVR